MAAVEEEEVELGFVEKLGSYLRLTSPFFPSKVGGKPAWLNLEDLPKSNELLCDICKNPMGFLIQVYSPFTDDPVSEQRCFHRTLFVFCCRNGKCYKRNSNGCVIVFRCQLPRNNKFYSSDPPPELEDDLNAAWDCVDPEFRPKSFACLCGVCGCIGDKKCSKCRSVYYCCREHQVFGWKSGHKDICPKLAGGQTLTQGQDEAPSKSNKFLFPEFEVITEAEPTEDVPTERSEEERIKDFEKLSKKLEKLGVDSKPDQDLEKLTASGKEKLIADKEFKNFKKRVLRSPDQILRFDRGGEPLWVSDEHQAKEENIPKCSCGADRQFEFQIMPQLLNYLQADTLEASIDWGTIAVFTCSQSCDEGSAYHAEFAWKQDFTDTGQPGKPAL